MTTIARSSGFAMSDIVMLLFNPGRIGSGAGCRRHGLSSGRTPYVGDRTSKRAIRCADRDRAGKVLAGHGMRNRGDRRPASCGDSPVVYSQGAPHGPQGAHRIEERPRGIGDTPDTRDDLADAGSQRDNQSRRDPPSTAAEQQRSGRRSLPRLPPASRHQRQRPAASRASRWKSCSTG